MSPSVVDHYLEPQGQRNPDDAIEAFKKFYPGLLAVFPDLKAEIHNQIAEGDLVATHKTLRGTHRGEFMGVKPTGKTVSLELIDLFRIADGKIVEHWAIMHWMGLMRQLGLLPMMIYQ